MSRLRVSNNRAVSGQPDRLAAAAASDRQIILSTRISTAAAAASQNIEGKSRRVFIQSHAISVRVPVYHIERELPVCIYGMYGMMYNMYECDFTKSQPDFCIQNASVSLLCVV